MNMASNSCLWQEAKKWKWTPRSTELCVRYNSQLWAILCITRTHTCHVYTRAHTCSAEYLYTIFGSALKNSNIIVHLAPSLLLRSQPNLTFPVAALRDHPVSVTLLTSPALPLLPKSVFPLHPCGHPRLHCSALSSIGLFLFCAP